jgi:hypothetical protein
MPTENDNQSPNTSVPQEQAIESEAGGRARTSDPTTSGTQDESVPSTSVPQENK